MRRSTRLQASTYFRQSLLLFHQTAKLSGIADCAVGLARVAAEYGQPARAARLIGFAETTRGALNTQDEYVTPSKCEVYDSLLVTLPAQLSPPSSKPPARRDERFRSIRASHTL